MILILQSGCAHASQFLVIGHRGASGYRPEHTLESFKLAIEQGADYIEPDLVATKDGILVVRHENEISGTTDVAAKFPNRKTTKTIDGEVLTGWFTEDFTLAEIKTLRARERLEFRDHSFDFLFQIPTLQEVLDLALKNNVGIYPELKHPSYFRSIGLDLEPRLADELKKSGLDTSNAKVIVQSFELSSLRRMMKLSPIRLVYLIDEADKVPYDNVLAGDPRTYGDLISAQSLLILGEWLYGIGPWKRLILPELSSGVLGPPTSLVSDAKAAGLRVHPYTFRAETQFLNKKYQGDLRNEIREFIKLGVDGVFTDFPDSAVDVKRD